LRQRGDFDPLTCQKKMREKCVSLSQRENALASVNKKTRVALLSRSLRRIRATVHNYFELAGAVSAVLFEHPMTTRAERRQHLGWTPQGLRREEAAAHVGVSSSKFDEWVSRGLMPKPKSLSGKFSTDCRAFGA
jgi:hypothetical protein